MVTWRLPLNGNEVQCALPTFSTGGRHENNVINWYVWLLVKPASLQLENTVCSRILRQVQPILPLQTRRHEAPSQEVVTPPKLEGRFFGSGQRDEHVRLESVDTAPLHVPSLNTHHNIQVLFFFFCHVRHAGHRVSLLHIWKQTLWHHWPEGMSTLAMGTVVLFRTSKMEPNGSRTAPLKLKPKMASTTRLYASSMTAAWSH